MLRQPKDPILDLLIFIAHFWGYS